MNDIEMMRVALDAARNAIASGDIPVGAAIFNSRGEIVSIGHNERELHQDPTAHAEIVAIRRAAEKLGDWHLTDHTLVVTLEPCAMCAGAIAHSRIARLYYGAEDPKGGAVAHGPRLFEQPTVHHRPEIYSGISADESAELLQVFFKDRR